MEGAREGEIEVAREAMREERNEGGPAHTLCSGWPLVFPLFLHRRRQLCFQVCFTHTGSHRCSTCACTRKYTHWGPGLHTCTFDYAHIHALSNRTGLQRRRVTDSAHAQQRRVWWPVAVWVPTQAEISFCKLWINDESVIAILLTYGLAFIGVDTVYLLGILDYLVLISKYFA